MRRFSGALVLSLLAPLLATAEDRQEIPWANKIFVPQTTPAVVVQDFGNVATGSVLVQRLRMTNIYQVPLNVKVMPPSCGCVSATASKLTLGPLETGELVVTMETRRFTGNKAVTLPVYFSGEGNKFYSTATLRIQAFIRTDVTLNPAFVQFGTVAQGKNSTQTLDIQYAGENTSWKLTEIASVPEGLDVQVVPLPRAQRGPLVYRVTASIKPDAPGGAINAQIQLKTSDPSNPLLSFGVFGAIQSPLSVVGGNLIRLAPVKVGETGERTAVIRGTKPFTFEQVTGEGDGLTVSYLQEAKPVQILKVIFRPSQSGELKRELKLRTSSGEFVTLTVEGSAEE